MKRVKHFILGQLAAAVCVEKTKGVPQLLDGGIAAESRPKLPRDVTGGDLFGIIGSDFVVWRLGGRPFGASLLQRPLLSWLRWLLLPVKVLHLKCHARHPSHVTRHTPTP